MSDNEYLQAASVENMIDQLTGLSECFVYPDGGFGNGETTTAYEFEREEISAELFRRFTALESELYALTARLAEAERLLREDARIFRLQAEAHRRRGTDASADEEMANGIYAFLHPQPPTAEGGETP